MRDMDEIDRAGTSKVTSWWVYRGIGLDHLINITLLLVRHW